MSRRRSSSFAIPSTKASTTAGTTVDSSNSKWNPHDTLTPECIDAAQEMWQLVCQAMIDPRTTQSILHSSDNVCLVKIFLDRAHQLDYYTNTNLPMTSQASSSSSPSPSQWLSTMLRQPDGESGYTPLHWAVLKARLPILLLLLRCIADSLPSNNNNGDTGQKEEFRPILSKRCQYRPLALLSQGDDIPTAALLSDEAKAILNTKDGEGLTAFQLLEKLQIRELEKCRKALVYYPLSDPVDAAAMAAEPTGRRGRQNSFDVMLQQEHAEQNELAELHVYMQQQQQAEAEANVRVLGHRPQQPPQQQQNDDGAQKYTFACEVLAFGRSNHLALGVQGGTRSAANPMDAAVGGGRSSVSSRPQRIQEFAQDRVGRDGSAVAVAASAHHTLVATRNGHLYAFGVGTGGRLGTGESERHCPAPTRVLGALEKCRVVAVAAAENHSLCVTSEGAVYAFGSNRFGQLGYTTTNNNTTTSTSSDKSNSASRCCLPRRVDDLWKKNILCVNVAAGEKHSVALTRRGEVYVWGCNASGQLGVSHRRSTTNSGMPHKVQRVDALWNAERRKVCIQIAASAQSTLVLAKPSAGGLPVNQVYSWGHGNHNPSKVHFSNDSRQNASRSEGGGAFVSSSAARRSVNPVAIACARFHNAAITADGRVYTWGFHAEPLGGSSSQTGNTQTASKNSSLRVCSCPQLVTGMLPEEGGGAAIAVAASENHTAVVTKEGALFTWGASYKKEVLGHEGVRWQPCPKRVAGVSRAVGLAAAKEHTILLVGATFPPIPSPYQRTPESTVPKLDLLAAQETAKHVDLFNALPLLMMSQRTSSEFLESYCREFIRLNLDGVLNLAQKSVLDIYLKEELANGLLLLDEDAQDGREMPFIIDVVLAGRRKDMPKASHQSEAVLSDPIQWIHACQDSIAEDELFADLQERFNRLQLTSSPPESNIIWTRTRSSSSIGSKSEAFAKSGRERSTSSTERCIMLTTNMDLSTVELAQEKHDSISKEIRGLKKKLNQIAKLEALYPRGKSEDGSLLSTEQQDKIARRTQLESELSIFEPALANVKKAILEFSCKPNDEDTKMYSKKKTPKKPFGDKGEDTPDQDGAPEQETFCCEDCKVTCPDQRSYALHLNGRKHRNRIAQLEEEKKKNTAELMMKQRHLQQMEAMMNPTEPMVSSATVASAWGKCNAESAVRSKYTLPPPPNAAQEIVPEAKPGPSPATLLSSTKSLKEIMEEEQRNAIQQKNPKKKGKAAKMALQLPSGSAPTMKSPPWTVKSQATPASPGFAHHQVPLLYSNKGSPWQASALPSTPLQPSPSSTPAMKSLPWAAKSPKSIPVASAPLPEFPSADPTPSPKGISSFGDFLNKVPVTPQQRPHSSSAPWAKAAPVSKPRPIGELTPTDKAKANVASTPTVRFQEIQKEEEEFKNVQDQSYTDNGKWFIGRRERAGSFASIQEIATQEREHQLLVEEQKRIEEQILREVAMAKKKQEQKQRQKAKKKAAQQKGKKQTSGNTVEEPGQPQQPSNKEKTGGNQKRRPNKRNQGRKQPQTTQNRGPDSASKGPDRSI